MVLGFAKGILEVEAVQAEFIGQDRVAILGEAVGHPVVAPDGLEPPDILAIGEGNAISLVGAIGL